MGEKLFSSDDKIQSAVRQWVKKEAGYFFDEAIRKLIARLTKCFEKDSDYVEK